MKEIGKFLGENWQLIVSVFLFILSFFISLFKKRKIDIFDTSIYSQLISLVNQAETIFIKGEDKKKFVIDQFFKDNREKVEIIAKYYRSPFTSYKDSIEEFKRNIGIMVESILSTPHKHKDEKE